MTDFLSMIWFTKGFWAIVRCRMRCSWIMQFVVSVQFDESKEDLRVLVLSE